MTKVLFEKKNKANMRIRNLLKKHDKPQYWLAHLMGINEGTLTRYLRYELPKKESKQIIEIIEKAVKAEVSK